MQLKVAIACAMLVSSISAAAQSASPTEHHHEQTSFGTEDTPQRPVALPAAALMSLRDANDLYDSFQDCAEREGIRVGEIPATWFVASEIRLSRAPGSGLIVRGDRPCFYGAHIVQFWVVARSAEAYKVLFTARADALDVLRTRSNGYRDLQLIFVTQAGRYVDYVRMRYSNGEYQVSGHHLKHYN